MPQRPDKKVCGSRPAHAIYHQGRLRRDDRVSDKEATTRLGRGITRRGLGNLPTTAMGRGFKGAGPRKSLFLEPVRHP
jgi:hypothetical protein